MTQITRRNLMILTAAAGAARGLAPLAGQLAQRRVLTLVYDRGLRMMRAVDRLVP